eukprot:TRINITY_DN3341_c0_g2_i2.p1 TRINITY_DN3341_c0_g2~~TRINITY_DN3341_c0_g2_i2.p1  ORF type:complete len:173 (+),score=49.03 TRINITY_DN3341_c0_g2_i2:57-575(+)
MAKDLEARLTDTKDKKKTLGHRVRSCVLLLGIFLYFLLAVCIPRAKTIDDVKDNDNVDDKIKKSLYLMAAGAGTVEGCAFFLGLLAAWGVGYNFTTKMVGTFFLASYVAGGVIDVVGLGMYTHNAWNWEKWQLPQDMSLSAFRSQLVGQLMGEACFIASGLLVLLPDFGVHI